MPSLANGLRTSGIPLVDFTPFSTKGTPEERLQTAKDLVTACQDFGFVYITNHGMAKGDLEEAFALTKELYDLPKEEKMKAPHPPGWAHHRGYSWPGLEKVSAAFSEKHDNAAVKALREVADVKESYEIGSEKNPDQPNIWLPSELLPQLRPFMTMFYWKCFEVASSILRALALGIGFEEENYLLRLHNGHYNQLRLLHYPPLPARLVEGGAVARTPAHTDWSSLTMLFQDDCGGLQVEDPTEPGTFVDVEPIEGALVMNVGDLLMRWSNGKGIHTSWTLTSRECDHVLTCE